MIASAVCRTCVSVTAALSAAGSRDGRTTEQRLKRSNMVQSKGSQKQHHASFFELCICSCIMLVTIEDNKYCIVEYYEKKTVL